MELPLGIDDLVLGYYLSNIRFFNIREKDMTEQKVARNQPYTS